MNYVTRGVRPAPAQARRGILGQSARVVNVRVAILPIPVLVEPVAQRPEVLPEPPIIVLDIRLADLWAMTGVTLGYDGVWRLSDRRSDDGSHSYNAVRRLADRVFGVIQYQNSPHPEPGLPLPMQQNNLAYWEPPILTMTEVTPVPLQFIEAYMDVV
jgi:hypothetical protein